MQKVLLYPVKEELLHIYLSDKYWNVVDNEAEIKEMNLWTEIQWIRKFNQEFLDSLIHNAKSKNLDEDYQLLLELEVELFTKINEKCENEGDELTAIIIRKSHWFEEKFELLNI